MSQYYYLAASLPMLRFEDMSRIKTDDFLEDCARLCKAGDFNKVQSFKLGKSETLQRSGIGLLWQQAEYGLRNELVKLRAKKHNIDQDMYLRKEAVNPALASKARDVFETQSPLKAEILFCKILWEILNDLEVGHLFDLDFLIIYYLRIQILERVSSFKPETGKQKLESILSGDTDHG